MDSRISEIAERIRALRDETGHTVEEMASATNVSAEEYNTFEMGETDLTFTFLYKCAEKFNVDIVELLTGENPRLSGYTIVRSGKGLPIERRKGFDYRHLASNFKNKAAEPFVVTAPFHSAPISVSSHKGQEFNYILKGRLRFVYDGHTEDLNEGDSVFYDSSKRHGMAALTEDGCVFLAIVLKGGP